MKCPKCGSEDVFVQNVQTGSTSTGKIVMREPRKRAVYIGFALAGLLTLFIILGVWAGCGNYFLELLEVIK